MPRKPLYNEWQCDRLVARQHSRRRRLPRCRNITLQEAHCQVDRGINRRRNFVKFNDTDDQLENIIFAVVFWSCTFFGRKILEKFCLYLLTFVSRSWAITSVRKTVFHPSIVAFGLSRLSYNRPPKLVSRFGEPLSRSHHQTD